MESPFLWWSHPFGSKHNWFDTWPTFVLASGSRQQFLPSYVTSSFSIQTKPETLVNAVNTKNVFSHKSHDQRSFLQPVAANNSFLHMSCHKIIFKPIRSQTFLWTPRTRFHTIHPIKIFIKSKRSQTFSWTLITCFHTIHTIKIFIKSKRSQTFLQITWSSFFLATDGHQQLLSSSITRSFSSTNYARLFYEHLELVFSFHTIHTINHAVLICIWE